MGTYLVQTTISRVFTKLWFALDTFPCLIPQIGQVGIHDLVLPGIYFLYTLSFIFSFFVIQKWTIVGNGTTTARRKENQHTVVICKSLFSTKGLFG